MYRTMINGYIKSHHYQNRSLLSLGEIKLNRNHGLSMMIGLISIYSSAREYYILDDITGYNSPIDEWKFHKKLITPAYDTSVNDVSAAKTVSTSINIVSEKISSAHKYDKNGNANNEAIIIQALESQVAVNTCSMSYATYHNKVTKKFNING